jgi:hypothetical protein
MKTHNVSILLVAAAGLLLGACTATKSGVEADFGNSVNQVTAASSANPKAHANPSAALVEGGDPDTLHTAVTVMRKSAAEATEGVKQDIVINVGGGK